MPKFRFQLNGTIEGKSVNQVSMFLNSLAQQDEMSTTGLTVFEIMGFEKTGRKRRPYIRIADRENA